MKIQPSILLTLLLPFACACSANGQSAGGLTSGSLGPPMPDRLHTSTAFPAGKLPSRASVLGLPLHSKGGTDLAGLQGPMRIVEGETMNWTYQFDWYGFTPDHRRVLLGHNTLLTFLGTAGSGFRFSLPGTGPILVAPPPNISLDNVLHFASVEVLACNKTMILNRLGEPTARTAGVNPGETAFVYSAGNWKAPTAKTTSYTTETFLPNGPVRRSETYVTSPDTVSYVPYHFVVVFDAQDHVLRVDDKAVAE